VKSGRGSACLRLLGGVARLFLLQLPRVLEHQRGERSGRPRAPDGTVIALGDEPGQQADVIEMGVGQDDAVERRGLERKPTPVAGLGLLVALEEAAVDEQPPVAELGQRQLPVIIPRAPAKVARHGSSSRPV
jgi:hypothetical protein